MPHGGGQLPIAYETTPCAWTWKYKAIAIASDAQLAPSTMANAIERRRSSTVSGAASSGTTTCSTGRCGARFIAAGRGARASAVRRRRVGRDVLGEDLVFL